MADSLKIKINGTTYKYIRPRLKQWIQLDELHSEIREATTRNDIQQLMDLVSEFLVVAFSNSSSEVWLALEWEQVLTLLSDILVMNQIRIKLPLIDNNYEKQEKKDAWEYKGRAWAYWVNRLASSYGWTVDKIEALYIEDAVQLLQEILLDQQFKREWEWSQSEIAYPYDASTKKSVFKPLARPSWMKPIPEAPKTVKMLKSMMPLGNVINMNDLIPKRIAK